MRILALAGLSMLAACTAPGGGGNQTGNLAVDQSANASANISAPAAAAPTPEVSIASAKLAGVDFGKPVQAYGTEPYWGLQITPGKLRFSDNSVGDGIEENWAPAVPVVSGKTAVIRTKTPAGLAVTITLSAESCLEVGEEDNREPLTAAIKIGDRTLMGCAGPDRGNAPAANNAAG